MLVEDEFLGKQTGFMERYWKDFDDDEENKLVYTDIFKEYQNEIEAYIESYLRRSVEKFSMETFTEELQYVRARRGDGVKVCRFQGAEGRFERRDFRGALHADRFYVFQGNDLGL